MKVINIHQRVLDCTVDQVGKLIDILGSPNDLLWPIDRWVPTRYDRPLGVGATGGHGPIGYFVEAYEPSRSIRFRFTKPEGFIGTHRFEVKPAENGKALLRHVIDMRVSVRTWISWVMIIRPLHDALMEDALDHTERSLGRQLPLRKWSCWVKFGRWIVRRRMTKVLKS